MARWFGGKGGADAVPREWSAALEKLVRPLETSGRGLASRTSDYVLTGSPQSVLADLSGLTYHQGLFNLWGSYGAARDDGTRVVFQQLGSVPSEVGVRLGRVIESAAAGRSLGQPAQLRWAEGLLVAFYNSFAANTRPREVRLPLDIAVFEAMASSAGLPASAPLVAAFRSPGTPSYYGHHVFRIAVRSLDGYAAAVARHAEELRPALAVTKVDDRLVVLEMLAGLPREALVPFAAELADFATATSSQVRAAAYAPLHECGDAAVALLKEIALGGKPDARLQAFERLCAYADARAWALEKAAEDRAPSVRALAEARRATPEGAAEPEPLPVIDVPTIDWRTPVTPEHRQRLDDLVHDINTAIDKANTAMRATAEQWRKQHGKEPQWAQQVPRPDSGFTPGLVKALEAGRPPKVRKQDVLTNHISKVLPRHVESLGLGPAGLTVLLASLGMLGQTYRPSLDHTAATAYNLLHAATGEPTLLELATMLDQVGINGAEAVLYSYASEWGEKVGRDWPDEHVAPFMTLYLDRVLGLLKPGSDRNYWLDPLAAFPALATLPTLPQTVTDALYGAALGTRKTERRPAQDALAKVPGVEARIIAALSDGKGEVRAQAAQWLGRLRHEPAIPALEAAVAKEKQDVAMGAMLDALQAMGQPVEKYLDRDQLAKQAAQAVAKGLPKDLAWFPWSGLPDVRWASGEAVPLMTLQWLLAQAVRAKTPEPNAVLRKYCAMFDPKDREQLGQFVLEAWIAEDIRPVDPADAHRDAVQAAAQMWASIQQSPQWHQNNPLLHATKEQIVAAYLPGYLKQPAGSAAASKGVLAVAAACAGERAAAVTQRYLKEWYGMRAAQGRALIVMLAWIDHPSATQLMLSVGSRFRTKSFQDEATKQAELLAERKGWTVGELADRTIPTAGLDESGILELSYGERVFTARLLPDLSLELLSPDGARIKALPAPRQTDDADAAKDAKKVLATAKKELKAVAQLQAERLYEALCTERTWTFEDWQRYLNEHPVLRHLTQRLAWAATTDAGVTVFRPLDDGTLTDLDDEEVTVPDDARIAVAHDSNLDAEQVAAWQAHFADYEVAPLFQQFGKGSFELPEAKQRSTQVTDFEGHLVEAFALRGRAGKLGYTRGATEDAGWFYTYDKRFPTLGITARVEFSGNFLPEENRTVALKSLSFLRHGPQGGSSELQLSEVPAILLSEAWNDLRLMAADGTGHDPDWEKKVEY